MSLNAVKHTWQIDRMINAEVLWNKYIYISKSELLNMYIFSN